MRNPLLHFFLILCLGVLLINCQNDQLPEFNDDDITISSQRAVVTPPLDWENLDWMPTPPNQTRIPSPWVGQGSLASTVGLDVLNDRKASDGWVLIYNTFDATAPGSLINPYFVLYNKYRGLMSVYLYITTQFVAQSSYLQDGLSIVSNQKTSILNFLGQEVVDATTTQDSYFQIQPTPFDGSYPLASNKWYMLQYELAYDPAISTIPYNQIQFNLVFNYCNINTITLEGEQKGELTGTIGESKSNIIPSLKNLGEGAGTLMLAGVGKKFVDHNELDSLGNNKLGVSKSTFKAISKGVKTAVSNGVSSLPSLGISVLSAVFGGSSSSTPVSLTMSTKINLSGSITGNGSFPSMPLSHWVPGTSFSQNAVGYIPNYNKPLGTINFRGKPDAVLEWREIVHWVPDEPFNPEYNTTLTEVIIKPLSNMESYLIVNPEVAAVANVTVVDQTFIMLKGYMGTVAGEQPIREFSQSNPLFFEEDNRGGANRFPMGYVDRASAEIAVKMTVRVEPKDGSPASTIIKTFKLNPPIFDIKYGVNIN